MYHYTPLHRMFLIDEEEIQSLGHNVRLKQNVLFFLCAANSGGSFSKLKETILFLRKRVTGETENKQSYNACLKDVGEHL